MLSHASISRYIDPGRPPAVVEVLPSRAEDLISAPATLLCRRAPGGAAPAPPHSGTCGNSNGPLLACTSTPARVPKAGPQTLKPNHIEPNIAHRSLADFKTK